ncbi:dihydrofolate reductase [Halorarum halophilum]|uniref:dihydrofolate reductase n=1 Tax=Halorarum halophilum TaxID=2743090 RepID=A0A7D5GK09_9EURY|nr:dihydrofolate reductase [Halobaculum halophilum]QLG26927.1 dihydrofolate reductase [Halobaculum halophilum]
MDLVIIAAVAANDVIGADGDIPWHHPEDLRHFKETTMGSPVVMGRRTYESIARDLGGPLPGRTNIVLSRSAPDLGGGPDATPASDLPDGVVVVGSPDEAVAAAEATGADTVYVAGGGAVYEAFLDRADRLVLTELHDAHEGDTVFPEWTRGRWREVDREERDDFDFVVYERIDG